MRHAHLVITENVGHVLVKPVELIPSRESELVDLGLLNLLRRVAFFSDPWRRAHGQARCSWPSHHDEAANGRRGCSKTRRSGCISTAKGKGGSQEVAVLSLVLVVKGRKENCQGTSIAGVCREVEGRSA